MSNEDLNDQEAPQEDSPETPQDEQPQAEGVVGTPNSDDEGEDKEDA